MADIPSKIQTVYQRIQKERKMVEGFRAMAAATSNYDVRASCEARIRDSEKTIQWFEQSLRDLQKRQGTTSNGNGAAPGSDASSIAASSGSSPYGRGGPGLPGSASFSGSQSTLGGTSSSSPSSYSRSSSAASTATANTSAPSSHRNRVLPPTPGSTASEEPFDPRRAAATPGPPQQQQPLGTGFNHDNGVSTLSIRRRPAFTNLDLIKYDTPLNSAKISKMLNQLEFKLRVEKEYMQGIEKMAKLYQVEGDKKARHDAEAKRIESKGKKDLLEASLKRYKTLDIMGGVFDEDEGEEMDEDAKGLNRRPVSGSLEITIKSARDLDHLPTNRRKPTETVVVVKVEDTPRARTHPSRTDRWNEDFELHVDKANEVEVTIYDKAPGTNETPTPIGMLWIRLSDVVDELRRKKVGAEAGAGWVTAAGVEGGGNTPPQNMLPPVPMAPGMGHQHSSSLGGGLDAPVAAQLPQNAQSAAMRPGTAVDGIDAWFSVEPAGQIELHLNFIKSNVRKRPYDAGGLGRQGAVRKRKEDVLEQNGHKFIQKQFYGVVLCAFCNEFLLKAAGMQCEDCRYTCHKKCYDKVVTKCVSKSNAEADKDGDKINHRIPHRFEPITTLSPSWCCHCGQIVPLSRKKARKCSECGLSCHADCAHLVPDFCGMSMEMARQIIGHTRTINQTRSSAHTQHGGNISSISTVPAPPARPSGFGQQQSYQQAPASPTSSRLPLAGQQDIIDGTNRMQLDPSKRPLPPSMPSSQQLQQQTQPQQGRVPLPSSQQQMPYSQQQQAPQLPASQQRPPPPAPQPGRNQYPLPAGASMQQRQSFTPLPPGAAGPPSSSQMPTMDQQAIPQQDLSRPPSQIQQPSQQRPGPGQRPYSEYQQQPMQGPRPMSQVSQQQRPMQQPPAPQQQQQTPQPMQIDPRMPGTAAPQKPTGPPQQRQSYTQQPQQQQQQYPLPGGQQPPTPTKARTSQMIPIPSPQQQQMIPQQKVARKVGLDDFNFLAVLGKGNFGKVMLAEEKRTGKQWAIKVLKKEFIIENDEIESTKSEKRVFLAAARERHPFLLDLHSCFQTETRIYFVMEYVQGGDLMLHIQRAQFTQRRARFYAAEVLLALEYFHKEGIVYRDLKLDNILLTLDGHVKLADYGLCKENMWHGSTTGTFCGTPEFMAPEILLEQRYGRAVDWWAFGVLIYEMLLGQSPFRGDDEDEIFDAILEDEPLYPIHMPHASVSILQQLLNRDPTRRLGSGPDDAEAIKRHPFFKDINWDDIMNKRIPSPYFPQVSGPLDTSNFDSEFTSEQPTLTPVHSQLSAQDQKEFKDFSWIGPTGMEAYK